MKRLIVIAVLVLIGVLLIPDVVSACPTCKDGMQNDPSHSNMVRGYQMSILFMMSMPFVIFGSLATYFYLEIRKAARQKNLAANR